MQREIDILREIARICAAGEKLDEALARWLASALEDFLNQRCSRLEEAFGLIACQGGMPWWLEDAVRERNAALRNLADLLKPAHSLAALVRDVHARTVRYGASAWLTDRHLDAPPPAYVGRPKEYLWRAYKSGAPMPLGERQLRTILGAGRS